MPYNSSLSLISRAFTAICLSAIFFSCAHKSDKEVAVNLPSIDWNEEFPYQKLDLPEIADISYIPLETNDSCLIGLIGNITIGDSLIAVADLKQKAVFIFDRQGQYLSKVSRRGEGPEEYPFLSNTAVDLRNKEIFVYSLAGNKIYKYNLDGKFIDKFELAQPGKYENFYNYDDSTLIAHDYANLMIRQDGEENEPYRYVTINKTTGAVTKLPLRIDNPIGNSMQWKGDTYIRKVQITAYPLVADNSRTIALDLSSDTIFDISGGVCTPLVTMTNVDRSRQIPDIVTIKAALGKYLFLEYIRILDVTPDNVEFDQTKGYSYIYDLSTGELKKYDASFPFLTDKTYHRDINNQSVQAPSGIYCRPLSLEMLLKYIENDNLEDPLKSIVEKADPESNPILMIAKFKD